MRKLVIPSLIAKDQKELDKRFEKVKSAKIFHLDVMDGYFVKRKSLVFDFKLPKTKNFEAHLMMKNPAAWIKKNARKVKTIIIHYESTKDPEKLFKEIKKRKKKLGLAINPKTSLEKILPLLEKVDKVLIMDVHPGKYGARFLPKTLKKISRLRKMKPALDIAVDGGVDDKRIKKLNNVGATCFVVGSFLQKSEDARAALGKLRKLIR